MFSKTVLLADWQLDFLRFTVLNMTVSQHIVQKH